MVNGVIEKVWEVMNLAEDVLKGGWGDEIPHPHPPLRTISGGKAPEGWMSLVHRYGGQGAGCLTPIILAVTGPKLLDSEEVAFFSKWIEGIGLKAGETVYFITSPEGDEARGLLPEIQKTFGVKVVFTLGELATQKVLNKRVSLPILRGQDYTLGKMIVLPTYHPRQVLEDSTLKKPVWDDLKRLKGILDYV